MFYSYAAMENKPSCIWRATATGEHPEKIWTEDAEPVTCLNDSIEPTAFYDAYNEPWLVYGTQSSGIWVIKLDQANTGDTIDQGYMNIA